jgi:hypothetical protein
MFQSKPRATRTTATCALHAILLTAVAAQGCGLTRDGDQGEPGESDGLVQEQVQGVSQTVNVPDPNGTYFAEVKANGTGCPPGTWTTSISPDGQVFTTIFSGYVTEVNPSVALSVKDCQLAIKMHTPEGRSFSVQTFSYSGYALLQPGVVGQQMASYYFMGNPVAPSPDSNRTELVGPYDSRYVFTDEVPIDARNWSPCGVERDLNVSTRVMLQNGNPRRAGYMNLSAVDGSGKLMLKIASRVCDPKAPTPPSPSQPLAQPADVRVTPSTIARDQPFTVSWTPTGASPDTTYTVEVHEHVDSGYALVWRSPSISGRSVTYAGTPLPKAGLYHVVVIARDGTRTSTSERILLDVRGAPSDLKPTPVPPPTPIDPPVSSTLPDWAKPLLGRYAVRTDAFAVSVLGPMLGGHQIALADIVQVADGLEMRARVCGQRSSGLGTSVILRTPEAYPEMRRKVILEPGRRWSTEGIPLSTGFLREGVPACAGRVGQFVPKRPDQVWIRGSNCRCGAVTDVPRLDDCRVVDPDGDGKPGLAFDWEGGANDGNVGHVATTQRGHIVGGVVDPGGNHFGSFYNDEVSYQLQCEPNACDVSVASRPCSPEYNAVQLVRLPAPPVGQSEWTCATLRAAENRLFPRPSPALPRTCSRSPLTDAP